MENVSPSLTDRMSDELWKIATSDIGLDKLEFMLECYEKESKPSPELLSAATAGATLIDVCDANNINQLMFNRGTVADGGEENSNSALEKWQYSLVFIHPNDSYGCTPVNLNQFYSVEQEQMCGALLHLLIHSPPIHDAVLQTLDSKAPPYVKKLLGYVRYCAGQSHKKWFPNAGECEKESKAELVRQGLPATGDSTSVANLLSALSPDILHHPFQAHEDLAQLPACTANVLVIHRANGRRYGDAIPQQIHDYHLVTVIGGNKPNDKLNDTVYMRWNQFFRFWKLTDGRNITESCRQC